MKSFFVIFIMSLVIFTHSNCGSGNEKNVENSGVEDITKNPDYQKGLEVVSKSDCYTCHKIDEQLTGPSLREIANKYAGMPDTIIKHLAGKVIKGGGGVWGNVLMTPHKAFTQEEAEATVKYILLLKK